MNSAPAPDRSIELALKQAINDHKEGRLQQAAQLYRTILQTKPNQPEANYRLGMLACEVGQHANALHSLKVALAANPANAQYAQAYVEALLVCDQSHEAQKVLKNAQKRGLDPVAAQSLQKKIKASNQHSRQHTVAQTQLDMNHVIALFNDRRFDELENTARAVLKSDSNSGLAWKILGTALQMQGKDSLDALKMAANLLPDDAEAQSNLGTVFRERGFQDEAVASYRQALQIRPEFAEAHNNLGITLQETGRLEEAVTSYRHALRIKPDYPEPHNNLGTALRALDRLDEATASYRQALRLNPNFAQAHNNLGVVMQDIGNLDAATTDFRRALEIAPQYAEAHYNFGNALKKLGQLKDAVAHYRKAVEFSPGYIDAHTGLSIALRKLGKFDDAEFDLREALHTAHERTEDLLNNLALVHRDQGKLAEAEAACRRALEIKPDMVSAITLMAALASDKGQFDEAESWYRRAIAIEPDSSAAWGGIALLRKMTSEDENWLEEAQRIIATCLRPQEEGYLRHSMGKYFDDVGDFDQAFANYQRANELARFNEPSYNRNQQAQMVDILSRLYDKDWVRRTRTNANTSTQPVFVVGMPRSGTSLTEQIIASHPAAFGAGELLFWSSFATSDESTVFNIPSDDMTLNAAGENYLKLLAQFSAKSLRVVDKMPGNFLFLGLIHATFPNAKIIHMKRNPIDTCLSAFFQPFESGHSYANDLDDLTHYYSEYLRIMQHWRTALPEHALLEVPYESLVEDQEGWSRKILEFIDLPWDPRCLEFHQTERSVSTVSKWQVRQKITRSSVERWRKYEKFVGPLLPLLETIEKN